MFSKLKKFLGAPEPPPGRTLSYAPSAELLPVLLLLPLQRGLKEISPPETPVLRKEDYIRKKEEEWIAKEEVEKKKAEEAARKAEEKKKMDEEKRVEAEERLAEEAAAKILPDIRCSCFDVLLHPIEKRMQKILGDTIDPHTDRRYIAWMTFTALAYNYNIWFCPIRLIFPCHNPSVNPYWIFFDVLSDLVYVTDIFIWQPRFQFIKAGDIIKDIALTKAHYRKSHRFKIESFFEFSDRLESIMAKAYIWRVARTIGYLLFALHLNACAFYVASEYQGIVTTTWVYDGEGTA
ncbi:hypothetical protein LDENG_00068610 [Lucifuga dentata]|nr:hypothetical protein LDENG_00068610 [Lucifuga dentata]